MDQNRLKKICETALSISYPKTSLTELRTFPTQKFDQEKNDWVPDSYSLFIMLKKIPANYDEENYNYLNDSNNYQTIESFFESLLGLEVCVDIS